MTRACNGTRNLYASYGTLTSAEARDVYRLAHNGGLTLRAIASRYSVSVCAVSDIKHGRTHIEATEELRHKNRPKPLVLRNLDGPHCYGVVAFVRGSGLGFFSIVAASNQHDAESIACELLQAKGVGQDELCQVSPTDLGRAKSSATKKRMKEWTLNQQRDNLVDSLTLITRTEITDGSE